MNRHDRRKARAHIAKAVRLLLKGDIDGALAICRRSGIAPELVEMRAKEVALRQRRGLPEYGGLTEGEAKAAIYRDIEWARGR